MGAGKGSGKSTRTWLPYIMVVMGFLIAALVMGIVAVTTTHWIDTSIVRTDLTTDASQPLAYSRYQGLARTCYTGGVLATLALETQGRNAISEDLIASGDMCVWEEGYAVFSTDARYDNDYVIRAHVLRTSLATLIAGFVFLVIAILMSACAMCSTKKGTLCGVSVISIIACLLLMVGMGMFTWVYFIQYQQIGSNYIEFWNGWKTSLAYQKWLSQARINFGWSYIVGWISTLFALLGAILSLAGLCCVDASADGAMNGMMQFQNMPNRVRRQQVEPEYNVQYVPNKVRRQQVEPEYDVQYVPNKVRRQQVEPEYDVQYVPNKVRRQEVEPEYDVQYVPQEMIVAPAKQRVDVIRVPAQQPQIVEVTSPNSTLTRYEAPPSYYNQPAVIYRPQNVTANPQVVPSSFYKGQNGNGNGNGDASAGYGMARIYNDAGASFTPREYVEASKMMEFT